MLENDNGCWWDDRFTQAEREWRWWFFWFFLFRVNLFAPRTKHAATNDEKKVTKKKELNLEWKEKKSDDKTVFVHICLMASTEPVTSSLCSEIEWICEFNVFIWLFCCSFRFDSFFFCSFCSFTLRLNNFFSFCSSILSSVVFFASIAYVDFFNSIFYLDCGQRTIVKTSRIEYVKQIKITFVC